MFERLQKPFLTVETGEAYQPIRLMYDVKQPNELLNALNAVACLEKTGTDRWNWLWKAECADIHFDSTEAHQQSTQAPHRLGTMTIKHNQVYLSLPSFKRACLAAPFFHRALSPAIATIQQADFVNKVFGLTERLPHGFTELFNDAELESIIHQRHADYEKIQAACERAESADAALQLLADYTKAETEKRLPFAERYAFDPANFAEPDVIFLSFYIFLRSRELVAIRRWFGESGYTLADATEETVEQVFGDMDIDIIE